MSRPAKSIDCPSHITGDAAEFWKTTQTTYGISDPSGLRLLRLACEALMTAEKAREVIARDGLTFNDRFGAPRPRPEARLQSAAMVTFRGLVRELRLDPMPEGKK
jgi:phage terminase small subunit